MKTLLLMSILLRWVKQPQGLSVCQQEALLDKYNGSTLWGWMLAQCVLIHQIKCVRSVRCAFPHRCDDSLNIIRPSMRPDDTVGTFCKLTVVHCGFRMRSTEGQELPWDDPVQISVFHPLQQVTDTIVTNIKGDLNMQNPRFIHSGTFI